MRSAGEQLMEEGVTVMLAVTVNVLATGDVPAGPRVRGSTNKINK